MEELLELEDILMVQSSQNNLLQLGESWIDIHNQMQSALGNPSKIYKTQNNSVSKKKLTTEKQPKYTSKVDYSPIFKQAKMGRVIERGKIAKKQLKLVIQKNQLVSLTDRDSNLFDYKYFDSINQFQQIDKELKQSAQITKFATSKIKSQSDNKDIANSKISELLSKVKQNQGERTSRQSLLIFPQINGTNKRQLPRIYKKKTKEKENNYCGKRLSNDQNFNHEQKSKKINNVFFGLNEKIMIEELSQSKIKILKCSGIMMPLVFTTTLEISNQKNDIKNSIFRSESISSLYTKIKSKSIHSLDSKRRRINYLNIKMKHKSLQKLRSEHKRDHQSNFYKNEIRNVGKQISELRQMKYRLYLKPQNSNLVR